MSSASSSSSSFRTNSSSEAGTLPSYSSSSSSSSSSSASDSLPSSTLSSSTALTTANLTNDPIPPNTHIHNNNTPKPNLFLAHNRAYQESMPIPPSLAQRLFTTILPYTSISWKDLGILRWLPTYTKQQFIGDINAAFVVSVVLVPQGMAYAVLAGLDPIYGLYSSTIPLLVWMVFTSSSQVSPGPVAPTALLLESVARQYSGALPRTPAFISTHFAITFTAGILQLILAGLRFGWIADLISWPVMSGFASSAAFIIIASQLSDFFGLSIPKEGPWVSSFVQKVYRAIEYLPTLNWRTTLISLFFLLTLLFWRNVSFRGFRLHPRTPIPIILVLLGVLISYVAELQQYGVKIIGNIPSSLPEPIIPIQSVEQFTTVLPGAVVVMLISYVQTVSLAVLFGKKVGENISGTAEMLALGSSWLVGSFFQSYSVAGSFTRTTVQSEAGARTPATIGFVGIIMIILLFTLTRVLSYLPMAVLAAIVMASTKQLINFQDAKYLWKAKISDFAQLAITFLAVLALDVTYGLIIGMGVSLLLVLYRSFRPRLTELGRLPGSDVFVALDRFTDSRRVPGVIILRLDGELHFGNVRVITDKLLNILSIAKTTSVARNSTTNLSLPSTTNEATKTLNSNTITPSSDTGNTSPNNGVTSPGINEESPNNVSIDITASSPNVYQPGSSEKSTTAITGNFSSSSVLPSEGFSGNNSTSSNTVTLLPPSASTHSSTVATNRKTRVVYALSIASTNPTENLRNNSTRRRGMHNSNNGTPNDPSTNPLLTNGTVSSSTLSGDERGNTFTGLNLAVLGVESAAVVSAVTLAGDEERGGNLANMTNNRYILEPLSRTRSTDGITDTGTLNNGNYGIHSSTPVQFVDSIVDLESLLQIDPLRAVIVDGSRVVDIDSTACREMQAVMETYAKASTIDPRVVLLFAALPGPVRDTLDLFGLDKATDPATTRFLSVTSAIASIYERLDEEDDWEEVTQNIAAYTDSIQNQRDQ